MAHNKKFVRAGLEKKRIEITNLRVYNAETGWFVADTEEGLIVAGESIIAPSGILDVEGRMYSYKGQAQFKIEHIFYQDASQIMRVLLSSGFLAGIRQSKAVAVWEALGENLIPILDQAAANDAVARQALLDIKGIGPVVREQMLDSWKERRGTIDTALLAIRCGMTSRQYRSALRFFEGLLKEKILEHPYDLTLAPFFDWELVDNIAQMDWPGKVVIAFDSVERVNAAVREVIRLNEQQGHTCMLYEKAIGEACDLTGLADPITRFDLANSGLVLRSNWLATDYWAGTEEGAAQHLLDLSVAEFKKPIDVEGCLGDLSQYTDLTLNEQQIDALECALLNNVSVVTGGPGTGKTTAFLNTLLNILDDCGITYTLCAPTGKAKSRMIEATGRDASTLHKQFFFRDSVRDLTTDYLIVDETSMEDMSVFARVLGGISEGQRLLLIGDADQLPPVGPGAPLEQLVLKSGAVIPCVHMDQIYRQAPNSGIIAAAHAVLNGEMPVNSREFIVQRIAEDVMFDRIRAAISWMEKEGIAFDDIQLLTPVNDYRIRINAWMQATYNPNSPKIAGLQFTIHDRVMQTRNNYDLGVMNGDVGIVKGVNVAQAPGGDLGLLPDVGFVIDDEKDIVVEFPLYGDVGYTKDEAQELVLASCVTIHKSQGSQFDGVIMVMPYTYSGFYMRQLPYTGITRAAKYCVVFSIGGALQEYVKSTLRQRRDSLFAYFLNTLKPAK